MSTIITLAICVILVVAIAFSLVKGVWAASKKITIPIQIVLFVVILVCIGRMLFTKENAQKLYDGIERSGVSQNMENTVRAALNMKPSETVATKEASATSVPVAVASTPAPAATVADTSVTATTASVPVTPVPASATPAPAPAPASAVATSALSASPEPVSEVKPDYSRLDKGKKTFNYALSFGAEVKVGFRDGTYRLIAESMGTLSSSEKKEIGKMIMSALSSYSGENVSGLDKTKVAIDVKYDESANRTRVFVTVPPSAIE